MTYTVIWTPEALTDFWELWTSSADKAAISDAVRGIERNLSFNPLSPRHEIVNGLGTVIRGRLGVDFVVDPQRQTVLVSTVWPAIDMGD